MTTTPAPYDTKQEVYNKFKQYPLTSYNIFQYLMNNEEQLWKILRYSDADSWNRPNLTMAEKASMIYAGQPNETDFRCFLSLGQDNSWTVEACFLRIAPLVLLGTTYVYGHMSIACELYTHFKCETLSNYTARLDYGTQRILEALNGAEIPDVGRLYFDTKASSESRSRPMGAIPYKGRATVLCNYYLG